MSATLPLIMPRLSLEIQSKAFWSIKSEQAMELLQSSREGLKTEDVRKRLEIFGKNSLEKNRRLDSLKILLAQFRSPLILVLVIATIITLTLTEWANSLVLIATIAVNAGLGFWQERKAENVLEELKNYIKTKARVLRDGHEAEIDAVELVPGDVIRVSQGMRIPADGRILEVQGLQIDESVLTGESLPIEKNTGLVKTDSALGDRVCMVWSGTLVVQGTADVLVTATDEWTEFGRIASLVAQREREDTPLQKAVSSFATKASVILGLLTIFVFIIGLLVGQDPYDMFFIAVAVAVSAVPEGLPIALTVILAVGVERLARKNGIVRRLLAAETLGSTSLILTDKTGTLTKAEMRLTDIIPYSPRQGATEELLRDALLNTDVTLENPEDKPAAWRLLGRSMEVSLVHDAVNHNVRLPELRREYKILDKLPFNSTQKYSAVLFQDKDRLRVTALGAPEVILDLCALPVTDKNRLRLEIERRARTGERLLGLAGIEVARDFSFKDSKLEKLSFQGLLALRDPIRPGIKDAITRITASGVRTVVVTGDHKGTAEFVARELGIMAEGHEIITGVELDSWPKEELVNRLTNIRVFARVTPEHKLMLTKLYKSQGEIVSVTGDGVNDAPALQMADVGVAVGSGTDVAKSASDLIILDNNFATIVLAIEEGRRILQNIRKAIVYLLSNAFSELVLIGGALLAGIPIPLSAIQILYVNFFSDSLPAIAYAFEQTAPGDTDKPTHAKHLLDKQMRFLIMVVGGTLSFALFMLYKLLLSQELEPTLVRSFIFAAFGTYSLLAAFALRSLKIPLWRSNPFGNKPLLAGVTLGLVLMAGAIYFPPLQNLLGTVALPFPWLIGVLAVASVNVAGIELGKYIYRNGQGE